MANDFLTVTKRALARHGKSCTYTKYTAGVYDIATGGSTGETSTELTIQAYKQHLRASQYYYPNLIGKDSAMFLIAADAIPNGPNLKDTITFDGKTYTISSYNEHAAKGEIVLYKVVAVSE